MADQSFRLVERRSMFRANIFLLECAAVLALQLAALQRYVAPGPQRRLLAVFAAIYMARLNVMARWLLPRELATEELTIVALVWVPMILASNTYGAALHQPESAQLLAAAATYVGGSILNSFSELQRKWWKARPENKGRCSAFHARPLLARAEHQLLRRRRALRRVGRRDGRLVERLGAGDDVPLVPLLPRPRQGGIFGEAVREGLAGVSRVDEVDDPVGALRDTASVEYNIPCIHAETPTGYPPTGLSLIRFQPFRRTAAQVLLLASSARVR